MSKQSKSKEDIRYHKDGSIWARGRSIDGVATGYWEWYRKNGVILRSGYFDDGEQTGEWTTYDKEGHVYKVTAMKPKSNK
jgi:antitoxin component YwqK of YwqJK toxin-antitoxin module